MQCECEHPVALQSAATQIGGDLSAHVWQPGRHLQHPVELLLGPLLLPLLVIEVLTSAGHIGPDRLDVPVGMRADPHLLPRRRDDEILDALQCFAIGDRSAVGLLVGEPAPAAHPPQAGAA